MIETKCSGRTSEDCQKCKRYWLWRSLTYDSVSRKKIEEFACSIGGDRIFDEQGNKLK